MSAASLPGLQLPNPKPFAFRGGFPFGSPWNKDHNCILRVYFRAPDFFHIVPPRHCLWAPSMGPYLFESGL